MSTSKPIHGFTKLGHAVHARTIDHHPADTAYARFNKRVALAITKNVGSMSCFWAFCALALCSLPATLVAAKVVAPSLAHIAGLYVASAGLILIVSWAAQSLIQLILLPALMVGQTLQNEANDARAAKQFEDTEYIMVQVNEHTDGGLKTVLDEVQKVRQAVDKLASL